MIMFDIDLTSILKKEVFFIDYNAGGISNDFIVRVNGSVEALTNHLLSHKLLNKVQIDFCKKKFSSLKRDGFTFVKELIPINLGEESLIYHGSFNPNLEINAALYSLSLENNHINAIRRISSNVSTNNEDLFSDINSLILKAVDSLNETIEEYNKVLKEEASKEAKYLSDWYSRCPEDFRNH